MDHVPELPTTSCKYTSCDTGGICARDMYSVAPVQMRGHVHTEGHQKESECSPVCLGCKIRDALVQLQAPCVTPLGLSCWHASLMYLYSAIYDSCELLMCTTGSLDAHTGHFRNLDT